MNNFVTQSNFDPKQITWLPELIVAVDKSCKIYDTVTTFRYIEGGPDHKVSEVVRNTSFSIVPSLG